jgi:hypothetical protein
MLDLDDVSPLDRPKAEAALRRVRLVAIDDPDSPAFHAAYDLLASFFGAQGELEEREHVADFVRRRVIDYGDGLYGTYHLVTAWEGDALVGVRDCYVDVDRARGVCLVALAHSFVVPAWRRSGLAAVLRSVPLTLARRDPVGGGLPTLVVAEMEPVDPEVPETVVRLIAYGRSGFSVLDPARLRYSQPEFRDLPDARHTGLPLLGVVQTRGVPPGPLPVSLVEAFPRLFYVCHRMFVPAERVDASEAHVLEALSRSDAPVDLLPLPTSAETLDRLAPLVRGAVLPLYPPALRGPDPRCGDPTEELARLRAAWSR